MRLCVLLTLLVAFVGCEPAKPKQPKKLPPAPPMPVERIDASHIADPTPEEIKRGKDPKSVDRVTQFVPSAEHSPPKFGNFGYTPNPVATKEFLQTLDSPTLQQAAPHLFDDDGPMVRESNFKEDSERGPPQSAKEPVLLYRALYAVSPGWIVGRQGIGDCVSWAWAHGCDIALAVDKLTGKSGDWKPAATAAIYGGSRVEARGRPEGGGGWSDGSYGAAAAKWVNHWGVVHRLNFPELGFDLRTYDKNRAKQWGNWGCGGQGDRGRLDAIAKQYPVGQVALVRTFEEAAAAIDSGYPVPVCSGQGFTSRRDSQGFCAPSGSWAHAMCFIGTRYGDRPGLLCLNSWGPDWVDGPKYPDDQPDGSFWVDKAIVDRMLAGNDSFAVANVKGFPKRKLRHELGW